MSGQCCGNSPPRLGSSGRSQRSGASWAEKSRAGYPTFHLTRLNGERVRTLLFQGWQFFTTGQKSSPMTTASGIRRQPGGQTMPLQHAKQLKSLKNCPPANVVGRSGSAYRFVFQPLDANSFVPVALIPSRQSDRPPCCSSWGISLFDTQRSAMERFKALAAQFPNIKKRLGSHIAEGALTPALGVCTTPKSGHFDLHPEKGAVLHPHFRIVGKLP